MGDGVDSQSTFELVPALSSTPQNPMRNCRRGEPDVVDLQRERWLNGRDAGFIQAKPDRKFRPATPHESVANICSCPAELVGVLQDLFLRYDFS